MGADAGGLEGADAGDSVRVGGMGATRQGTNRAWVGDGARRGQRPGGVAPGGSGGGMELAAGGDGDGGGGEMVVVEGA